MRRPDRKDLLGYLKVVAVVNMPKQYCDWVLVVRVSHMFVPFQGEVATAASIDRSAPLEMPTQVVSLLFVAAEFVK